MKRIIRNIIGIMFTFLIWGDISISATIISTKLSEGQFTGGTNVFWSATNHYIEEIEVMRSSKGEAFSVVVPEGALMRGWHTAGNRNEYQRFTQRIEIESDIGISYGGTLQVKDYSNPNYNVKGTNVNGNQITMELKSKKDSNDRPTFYGTREISVSGGVPDGRYTITTTLILDGVNRPDVQRGTLIIRTLPSVTIEDIDFGYYSAGERINLTETSPIAVRGGTAEEKFTLSIEGAEGSQGINIGQRQYLVNLKNPNGDEEIPVNLSITGLSNDPTLEAGGNADAILEAKVNTILPSTHGTYSGRAKIVFQYD